MSVSSKRFSSKRVESVHVQNNKVMLVFSVGIACCSISYHMLYSKMELLTQTTDKLVIGLEGELLIVDKKDHTHYSRKIPDPLLPPNLKKGQEGTIQKGNRTVIRMCCSRDNNFVAVATENKQVVLFDRDFKVVRNFIVRAVSAIDFTLENDILIADRTGDVSLYKLNSEDSKVLLGHLSILLDVKLSECGKYIITCDRDEKIRVSHYPNAYNIQSYCLGHKEFVVNIHLDGKLLISASGDGTIRFWDFVRGLQIGVINTNENIHNKNLIRHFVENMDLDKVEASAVPIKNMQICKSASLIIGVSLACIQGIQLYEVVNNFPEIKATFLKTVTINSNILSFSLGVNLYVLTTKAVQHFKCINGNCIEQVEMSNVYEKCKDIIAKLKAHDISMLYKRKFDNMQEYLKRKKQRLEEK